MISYNSMAERLMLTTVKIITSNGTGTGFFFMFKIKEKMVPILLTNKHVVNNKEEEEIKILFHIYDKEKVSEENFLVNFKIKWFFHEKYDLCFSFIGEVLNYIEENFHKKIAISYIEEEVIMKDLDNLQALEEVTMIGYPIGLHDEVNNLPIFRKGYTASHPALSFNNEGIGLVDMACFPGSSGSPIFILNEGSYIDSSGIVIGNRLIFLGILFAGPTYTATGEIIMKQIDMKLTPISSVNIMTNLGYYIQAKAILDFKNIIIEKLENQ